LAVSLTSIALAPQFVFTAFRTSDEMEIARRNPNFGQMSAAS
jgi:hypothetical protein